MTNILRISTTNSYSYFYFVQKIYCINSVSSKFILTFDSHYIYVLQTGKNNTKINNSKKLRTIKQWCNNTSSQSVKISKKYLARQQVPNETS